MRETSDNNGILNMVQILSEVSQVRERMLIALKCFYLLYAEGFIPFNSNDRLSLAFHLRSNIKGLDKTQVEALIKRVESFKPEIISIINKYIIEGEIPEEKVPNIMEEYWMIYGLNEESSEPPVEG